MKDLEALHASGTMERPGFRDLVGRICEGTVGAVFCLEASRLARNGRDWHHLLELCGMVGAHVIDGDGVHDPALPNDRLLLGLKGTMSEFELTLIRKRLVDAAVAKARRGELRICVPVGYIWNRDGGLTIDPDQRIQEGDSYDFFFVCSNGSGARHKSFGTCAAKGCSSRVRQRGNAASTFEWRAPAYRNVIAVLQNPFYAGAYAYGKSKVQTQLVDGSLRKRLWRNAADGEAWTVLTKDHHESYVSWETFELNRASAFAEFVQPTRRRSSKSSRGGLARGLMAGLLRCHRCGRMLQVAYSGPLS